MARTKKSTIVRTYRELFRILERLAPAAAARLAARLWCTPPKSGRRAGPAAAPGERFLTPLAAAPGWAGRPVRRPVERLRRGRQFAVPVAGRGMVVAEVWGDGPAVYLLHGWGGRRTQLGALVEPLLAAGHRVVALDAPGHGESGPGRLGGRRTTLAEFAEALAAVVAVTGPAHAVVAHSAGGNAAGYAVRRGLPVRRLVLVAPVADPLPYLRGFAQALGTGPRTWPRLRRQLERLVGRELAEFDLPARMAGDRRSGWPELLVIHDRADREIRYADGQALAAGWPVAELLSTDGLGHRRILADPAVVDATVSFVTAAGHRPGTGTGTGRRVRVGTAAGSTARS